MIFFFVSEDLYQEAVKCFSDQSDNGFDLDLLEGNLEDFQRSRSFDGQDDTNSSIIIDDRFDILKSASTHGLKTVLLNPNGELVPELVPVQDWEIVTLEALKDLSTSVRVPTLSQCLTWWDEWDVPENVRQHSLTVSHAAYTLAVWIRKVGIAVNPILTHRGGILHDLDKIKTLNSAGSHGQIAAAFLEQQGFPEVGEIVQEHIMSTILNPGAGIRSWEIKLVYFCDKLAEGDQLVPFNQRLSALYQRYPQYKSVMQQAEGPVWELSRSICSILSIPSHETLLTALKESRSQVQ